MNMPAVCGPPGVTKMVIPLNPVSRTRVRLMRRVWGDDTHITERSVDTLVKRVRRKIEPDSDAPRYILTVWGAGYKFAEG